MVIMVLARRGSVHYVLNVTLICLKTAFVYALLSLNFNPLLKNGHIFWNYTNFLNRQMAACRFSKGFRTNPKNVSINRKKTITRALSKALGIFNSYWQQEAKGSLKRQNHEIKYFFKGFFEKVKVLSFTAYGFKICILCHH